MAEFEVTWLPEALEDVDEIFDKIAEKSQSAAERITASLLNRPHQLKRHPRSGQREELLKNRGDSIRYLLEGHYKLLYMVLEKQVLILQVFDTRKDPGKLNI